jgi:hypothetical protein
MQKYYFLEIGYEYEGVTSWDLFTPESLTTSIERLKDHVRWYTQNVTKEDIKFRIRSTSNEVINVDLSERVIE